MRRWLVTLMLALLPIQLCWAAVGPYQAHGDAAVAASPGQHSHAHDHGDADQDPLGIEGVHADCEICHLVCSAAVPVPLTVALPLVASVVPSHAASPPGRHLADPPDRPQWPHSRAPV